MKLVRTAIVAITALLVGCSGDDGAVLADPAAATPQTTTTTVEAPAKVPGIACNATRDAMQAAAIVFLADHGSYPRTFAELVDGAYVAVPGDVEVVPAPPGDSLDGPGWTLQISGGGDSLPDFVCVG